MSILAIDTDTFKWLQSLEIVKDGRRNSQNKIELPQSVCVKFFDGILISKILKIIIQNESEVNQNLLTKMKTIKENSTPAIRLYNWNLIIDVLKAYKFTLDYVEKSKILNLESPPLQKILIYLKGIHKNQNGNFNDDSTIQGNSSMSLVKQKDLVANPLQIDIKTIGGKVVSDAMNIMEFFVISLSKNFKLSPQHTLNLFLDNNKYLAHLLVKGIKESFEHVIAFENQILASLQFIVLNLFSIDENKSLEFFFEGLKSCLISKNLEVALKCLTIFQKVHQIYVKNNLDQQSLLNWFRKQGVNMLLFSSKRHEQTLEQAIQMAFKLMEKQLFQFIRPNEKSPLWKDDTQKLQFYCSFLFVAQNQLLIAFADSTCLIEWNKYFFKSLKKLKYTTEQKILITIMHRSWIQFPKVFQSDNGMADTFITFLKGTSFSNDFMLFIDSIKTMFDLMEVLGKRKNSFAPIFYKTLVSCLSFESSEERVIFIMDNFISVFGDIQNLPGSLLVEPLLKSIERNCTSSSLRLCRLLLIEQKVKEVEASEIVDVMTKVFFEEVNQGPLAIQYIFECLPALDEEVQNQFLVKNGQLCLSHFFSLSKSIKKTFPELVQTLRKYEDEPVPREGNSNSYMAQVKRYLLIENLMRFIEQFIKQGYEQVVKQLEESVFMTYIKVKNELHKEHIAMILHNCILRKYYDVEEQLVAVIDKYERKYQQYISALHNRSISIDESDGDISPVYKSPINESRLYASKSVIIDESTTSPSKPIRSDIFKPQKSALKDLQAIKSRMIKLRTLTQEDSKQKDLIQEKKDLVRSLLNERRKVRYGAKYDNDLEYKCIYDFQSVKQQKTINGMPNIEIVNLPKQEEDIFVSDVDSLMKKYRKVWRFLFFKYSTFGAKNTSQTKIQEKINMAEVWKMHKQYNAEFIKKEESFAIVKQVNEAMKRKHDLQNLTYLGFEEYIVQFCIYAYNKIGISSLSPGQKVAKLISQFKAVTEQKGGNVEMFANPQEMYFLETDVIKEYNKRLAQNPEYILPEGYKKIRQTEFVYDYEFTTVVKEGINDPDKRSHHKSVISSSYFTVLEVLDSIFASALGLGFHILQPKTQKVQKVLAKPALFQQITEKLKNHKEGYLMPKRQINSTYIEGRQKVNFIKPQFHPMVQFSLGIKLGLSAVPLKYKYIGEQVAYWMDDMLDAIQNGSPKVKNKADRQIENEAIKKKKLLIHKLKSDMKQKQKIYKQRSQSVKLQAENFQVVKQQFKKKRIQDMKAKQIEDKKRKQAQMKKKISEFQKAKKYFSEKHQQQKQKLKQQQQVKKVEKQQYKKKVQHYFKLKKQQLQQKQMNLKREKQLQAKKQKQDKEKHQQFTKKVYFSVLKKDEEALQKIQNFKDKYQDLCNQSFVQQEFQIHRKSLNLLFELLLKYEKSKISATDSNQISQNTFNFFTLKFKIVPFMLEKNLLSRILISIGKDQNNKAGFGINYRGFEQALLKIIIKSKKMLNQLVEEKKRKLLASFQVIDQGEKERSSIMNGSSVMNKSSLEHSEMSGSRLMTNQNLAAEYLFDPEGVTQETIRHFMLFLNLPDYKLGMEQRFRQAIEAKTSKPLPLLKKKQMREQMIGGN